MPHKRWRLPPEVVGGGDVAVYVVHAGYVGLLEQVELRSLCVVDEHYPYVASNVAVAERVYVVEERQVAHHSDVNLVPVDQRRAYER